MDTRHFEPRRLRADRPSPSEQRSWWPGFLVWASLALAGLALAAQCDLARGEDLTETRIRRLSDDLDCLVCEHPSLNGSRSSLAGELRDELRHLVELGRTDSEVVGALLARYGGFIQYRPAMNENALVLWFGPIALLGLSLIGLGRLVWRQRVHPKARSAQASREVSV